MSREVFTLKISCTETMFKWPNTLAVEYFFFSTSGFDRKKKVKLGSPLCKYLLTINDLYNGTVQRL